MNEALAKAGHDCLKNACAGKTIQFFNKVEDVKVGVFTEMIVSNLYKASN